MGESKRVGRRARRRAERARGVQHAPRRAWLRVAGEPRRPVRRRLNRAAIFAAWWGAGPAERVQLTTAITANRARRERS